MTGVSPSHNINGNGNDTRNDRLLFRESAEAFVLLNALALIDFGACVEEVERLWPANPFDTNRYFFSTSRGVDPFLDTSLRRGLGFAYHVSTSDELAPISERVFGVQYPSEKFLSDFGYVKHKLSSAAQEVWLRPIPVRIHLNSRSLAEFTQMLRQLLHGVTAQRTTFSITADTDTVQAAAITRFEINEIRLEERPDYLADAQSLDCLARLTQLGIRVRYLPPISHRDLLLEEKISVVLSLQALIPPNRAHECGILDEADKTMSPPSRWSSTHGANDGEDSSASQRVSRGLSWPMRAAAQEQTAQTCPEYVHANGDMTVASMAALFSAVQVSRTVKRVEMEVEIDFDEGELGDEQFVRTIEL